MNVENHLRVILQTCGCIAFITNSVLIFLILFRSPKSLGAYIYLMAYNALFQLVYAILDFLTLPEHIANGSGYLIIMDPSKSLLPDTLTPFCNTFYIAMFGTSLANFGAQFIFRYLIMTGNKFWTSSSKVVIWIVCPMVYGGIHATVCAVFCSQSKEADELLRKEMPDNKHLDSIRYTAFHLYPTDQNGRAHVNWRSIIGVLVCGNIVAFSIFIMFFFGAKCYHQLKKLTGASSASENYRSIQNQLFLALVFQTMIPFCFMHIPSSFIVIACFVNSAPSIIGPIYCISIALYPLADPVPNIFIIRPYRDALIKLFQNCKLSNGVRKMFLKTNAQVFSRTGTATLSIGNTLNS